MYQFGDFTIYCIVERKFKLDGGSMFGVVPKKIWGRLINADNDNLIPMQTNLFLVDTGDKKILCDTGFGTMLTEKEQKVYSTVGPSNLESGLDENGFAPDDIDFVFLSHLHTDHAGGAVKDGDGKVVPRFRKGRYLIQKDEWEDALHPDERTAPIYFPDRLLPLQESGQLELIDGNKEILPGVKLVKTGGHTPGHMGIEFTSGGETIVYYGDIIPSAHHFKIPYVASVDLFPLDTMKIKRSLTERALAGEIYIAFDHDIEMPIGKVGEEGIKTVVTPVIPMA